jgi:Rrf2 family protein
MIYSNPCQYAIRALTYMAHHRNKPCLAREISQEMGLPYQFLTKILQDLRKKGLLNSAKGRGGGFQLAKPPSKITLYDVKEAIDGVKDLEECAVGIRPCDDHSPCPIHHTFSPIRTSIRKYLKKVTVAQMASALKENSSKNVSQTKRRK